MSATGNFPDGSRTPTVESSLVTPPVDAPQIQSASADTPTTAIVAIEPPLNGSLPTSYTVTLTPAGGGTPITVVSPTPVVDFSGLTPNTTYTVTAVATMPDGSTKPVIGAPTVSTPASYNVPALTTTTATGPTTGAVTIDPPNTPVQPTSYTVTLTPVGGGSPVRVTCANPDDCPVTGLAPDTTYAVVAVGNLPGGGTTPASGTGSLTTPTSAGPASPSITDTNGTSPFTGTVSIAPPPTGAQPTNYTVTLTPIDGGEPITVTCSTPTSCPVTGLLPDTTYLVRSLAAPPQRARTTAAQTVPLWKSRSTGLVVRKHCLAASPSHASLGGPEDAWLGCRSRPRVTSPTGAARPPSTPAW